MAMHKESIHIRLPPAPRCNALARHPLLRKGGPHGPTRKAERTAQRQALRKQVSLRGED